MFRLAFLRYSQRTPLRSSQREQILQSWQVFIKVPQLFVLVPALLGLKGNLEMTLASRLSTQVRGVRRSCQSRVSTRSNGRFRHLRWSKTDFVATAYDSLQRDSSYGNRSLRNKTVGHIETQISKPALMSGALGEATVPRTAKHVLNNSWQ